MESRHCVKANAPNRYDLSTILNLSIYIRVPMLSKQCAAVWRKYVTFFDGPLPLVVQKHQVHFHWHCSNVWFTSNWRYENRAWLSVAVQHTRSTCTANSKTPGPLAFKTQKPSVHLHWQFRNPRSTCTSNSETLGPLALVIQKPSVHLH